MKQLFKRLFVGDKSMESLNEYIHLSREVSEALCKGMPIVSLETTIISHGMPFPKNVETAFAVEQEVYRGGALPATIGILDGKIRVGLTPAEIERFGMEGLSATKTSRRDFAYVLSKGLTGSLTVSGTMIASHLAGIPFFATGGIGGVHRHGEDTMDISADLEELSNTPVALIRYREAADEAGYLTSVVDNLRLLMGDVIRINQNSPASGGRGLFGSIGTSPQLRILYDIEAQYSDIVLINLSLGNDSDTSRRGSNVYYMSADFVASTNNGYAVDCDPKDFYPNYTNIDSTGRAALAELLKTNLARMVPSFKPENGLDAGEEKDLALLRLTNYVSASLVPGYLSNDWDRTILGSEQGRAGIGQAIANAVFQYFIAPSS
jgi:hypothetical protein